MLGKKEDNSLIDQAVPKEKLLSETPEEPRKCTATLLSSMTKWDSQKLDIKWHEETQAFYVLFKGSIYFDDFLWNSLAHKVPLEIARTSKCQCGSDLSIGNHRMVFTNNDFGFYAEYYCEKCKQKQMVQADNLGNKIKQLL